MAQRMKKEKIQLTEELIDVLGGSEILYLADFTGLSVKEITELRRRFREAGSRFLVVKNRLALRALEQLDVPEGSLVVDNLLAVLREALTNVARHARASRVEVDVDQRGAPVRTLRLRVHDDGAGPARQALPPGPRTDGGHGLVNMECRATALGGSFSFTGGPGEGSTLVWEVPLPAGA